MTARDAECFALRYLQGLDIGEVAATLARGYELKSEGLQSVVWASADGLPLQMDIDQGTLMTMSFSFRFDRPVDATMFSTAVPAGYALATDED